MPKSIPETVLSIDFSLDKLDVGLRDGDDAWVWSHQSYDNNWSGYQTLKGKVLAHLQQQAESQLAVVGESTGLLWWHAYYQIAHDADLAPYSPQLVLLNPAHVKHFRKALPERDKADMLDPELIERYYRTHDCRHPYQFYDRYLHLRFLTRAYCRLSHRLAAEKAYYLTILYLSASEYQRLKPFSNLLGVTSQQILGEYPDIAAIADIPTDTLVEQLLAFSRHTLPDPHQNARKLQTVAQDSYPCPAQLNHTVYVILQFTLQHIRLLEDHKRAYTQLIEQELALFPEAQLALDQPGLGPILVAGCLGEIQATQRFITGDKFDRQRQRYRPRRYRDGQAAVAKLAGLWWPKNDSGRFSSQERHLARERNPYLRYWFTQAAFSLQCHDPDYAAYYNKKYLEANKHHHKRALVLTARKSVRLIFALLHKGQRLRLEEGDEP